MHTTWNSFYWPSLYVAALNNYGCSLHRIISLNWLASPECILQSCKFMTGEIKGYKATVETWYCCHCLFRPYSGILVVTLWVLANIIPIWKFPDCSNLLNQACAGLRPAHTWFLKIDPVQIVSMCVCVCVFVRVSVPEAIKN